MHIEMCINLSYSPASRLCELPYKYKMEKVSGGATSSALLSFDVFITMVHMKSSPSFFVFLATIAAADRTFTVKNNCAYTVWSVLSFSHFGRPIPKI